MLKAYLSPKRTYSNFESNSTFLIFETNINVDCKIYNVMLEAFHGRSVLIYSYLERLISDKIHPNVPPYSPVVHIGMLFRLYTYISMLSTKLQLTELFYLMLSSLNVLYDTSIDTWRAHVEHYKHKLVFNDSFYSICCTIKLRGHCFNVGTESHQSCYKPAEIRFAYCYYKTKNCNTLGGSILNCYKMDSLEQIRPFHYFKQRINFPRETKQLYLSDYGSCITRSNYSSLAVFLFAQT